MHSYKYNKLRNEKHKAKRAERQKAPISHAKRAYMNKIIQGKENDTEKTEPIKDFRFLEKLRLSIRRSVFR